MGRWESQDAVDLAAWRTLSSKDLLSISVNPLFYSDKDLHVLQVALDSAALPITAVTDDIDGQIRNSVRPDIGADEFDFLTDDLGIVALLEPGSACELGNTQLIRVRIQNYGGTAQTGFDLAYRLNGGSAVVENVGSLNVLPGGTAEYTFTTRADLSDYRLHQLELYTLLVGD